MNVRELIEALQKIDPELVIASRQFDGELYELKEVSRENSYYYAAQPDQVKGYIVVL